MIRSCWNERQPKRCVWLLDLIPLCYRKRQFISTTFRSITMKDCPLNSSIKFYHSFFWLRLTTPQAVNSLGTSQIGLQCAKFCWGSCQGLPRCLSCLDPKGKHWVCHSICCIGCIGLSIGLHTIAVWLLPSPNSLYRALADMTQKHFNRDVPRPSLTFVLLDWEIPFAPRDVLHKMTAFAGVLAFSIFFNCDVYWVFETVQCLVCRSFVM